MDIWFRDYDKNSTNYFDPLYRLKTKTNTKTKNATDNRNK